MRSPSGAAARLLRQSKPQALFYPGITGAIGLWLRLAFEPTFQPHGEGPLFVPERVGPVELGLGALQVGVQDVRVPKDHAKLLVVAIDTGPHAATVIGQRQ